MCAVHREELVNSSVTVLLFSLRAAVLTGAWEGSMKCIHVIVGEGKAHAQYDSGDAETVMNRGIDGLVVE